MQKNKELADVKLAEKKIFKAGFGWMKFELEAMLWRRQEAWGEARCHNFIRDHIPPEIRSITVFDHFYYDGSVDSELTVTLPTDKAHEIVHYIKAFNELAKAIGKGINVENAGMHVAVLTNSRYPCSTYLDTDKLNNFKREVNKLLPAMFFMAGHSYKSRPLGFRGPQIGMGKHVAINICPGGLSTALEYRIFETCYDKPEEVYNKIEVIAQTLKYYSHKKNNVKLPGPITLGNGGVWDNLFQDEKALLLLEKSIKYVQPRHKTFEELKKERNFKIDILALKRKELKLAAKIESEVTRALGDWEKKAILELRAFRMEIKDKKGWKSLESNDKQALDFLAERNFIPRKPNKEVVERAIRRQLQPAGGGGDRTYNLMPVEG
jgi:hypothetical protein